MEKKKINIGTVGHVDHGKTTIVPSFIEAISEGGLERGVTIEVITSPSRSPRTGLGMQVQDTEKLTTMRIKEVREYLTVIDNTLSSPKSGQESRRERRDKQRKEKKR